MHKNMSAIYTGMFGEKQYHLVSFIQGWSKKIIRWDFPKIWLCWGMSQVGLLPTFLRFLYLLPLHWELKKLFVGVCLVSHLMWEVTRILNDERCTTSDSAEGSWLNEYPDTAEGCAELVLAFDNCDNTYFSWAHDSDRNCWCVPFVPEPS